MTYFLKAILLAGIIFNIGGCAVSIDPYGPVICTTWENKPCGPTADCAALLYNKATALMSTGRQLAKNGLYMASATEYQHAVCLLKEAAARLKEAKTQDFDDWKVAVMFGLEKRIQESIDQCGMFISRYQWRR